MRSILIALTGVVAPGFAQGLIGHRRAMWIVMGAVWLPVLLVSVTIWALALAFAVWIGALVHAGIRHFQIVRSGNLPRYDWLHPVLAFTSALVFGIVFQLFVVEAYKMPSSSMAPTLQLGDHLFIQKLWGGHGRGEIIVFSQPCQPERDYIKRIVAVARDTVEIRCSVLYVNGSAVITELVEATCTYDDRTDDFGGREAREETYPCSRYRETIDGHTFETLHPPGRPLIELQRRRVEIEARLRNPTIAGPRRVLLMAELDKLAKERAAITAELERMAMGARDHFRFRNVLDSVDGAPTHADDKDFPQDMLIRNCASNPYESANASNQRSGKIVVTGEVRGEHDCAPFMHFVVPDDSVFVMGDNRGNSNDSRYWGVVPVENIKGRAVGLWLPLSRFGAVR